MLFLRVVVLHRVIMFRSNIEFQLGYIPILKKYKYSTKNIWSTNGRFPIQHVNSIFRIPIMNKLNSISVYKIASLDRSKLFELEQRQLSTTSFHSENALDEVLAHFHYKVSAAT